MNNFDESLNVGNSSFVQDEVYIHDTQNFSNPPEEFEDYEMNHSAFDLILTNSEASPLHANYFDYFSSDLKTCFPEDSIAILIKKARIIMKHHIIPSPVKIYPKFSVPENYLKEKQYLFSPLVFDCLSEIFGTRWNEFNMLTNLSRIFTQLDNETAFYCISHFMRVPETCFLIYFIENIWIIFMKIRFGCSHLNSSSESVVLGTSSMKVLIDQTIRRIFTTVTSQVSIMQSTHPSISKYLDMVTSMCTWQTKICGYMEQIRVNLLSFLEAIANNSPSSRMTETLSLLQELSSDIIFMTMSSSQAQCEGYLYVGILNSLLEVVYSLRPYASGVFRNGNITGLCIPHVLLVMKSYLVLISHFLVKVELTLNLAILVFFSNTTVFESLFDSLNVDVYVGISELTCYCTECAQSSDPRVELVSHNFKHETIGEILLSTSLILFKVTSTILLQISSESINDRDQSDPSISIHFGNPTNPGSKKCYVGTCSNIFNEKKSRIVVVYERCSRLLISSLLKLKFNFCSFVYPIYALYLVLLFKSLLICKKLENSKGVLFGDMYLNSGYFSQLLSNVGPKNLSKFITLLCYSSTFTTVNGHSYDAYGLRNLIFAGKSTDKENQIDGDKFSLPFKNTDDVALTLNGNRNDDDDGGDEHIDGEIIRSVSLCLVSLISDVIVNNQTYCDLLINKEIPHRLRIILKHSDDPVVTVAACDILNLLVKSGYSSLFQNSDLPGILDDVKARSLKCTTTISSVYCTIDESLSNIVDAAICSVRQQEHQNPTRGNKPISQIFTANMPRMYDMMSRVNELRNPGNVIDDKPLEVLNTHTPIGSSQGNDSIQLSVISQSPSSKFPSDSSLPRSKTKVGVDNVNPIKLAIDNAPLPSVNYSLAPPTAFVQSSEKQHLIHPPMQSTFYSQMQDTLQCADSPDPPIPKNCDVLSGRFSSIKAPSSMNRVANPEDLYDEVKINECVLGENLQWPKPQTPAEWNEYYRKHFREVKTKMSTKEFFKNLVFPANKASDEKDDANQVFDRDLESEKLVHKKKNSIKLENPRNDGSNENHTIYDNIIQKKHKRHLSSGDLMSRKKSNKNLNTSLVSSKSVDSTSSRSSKKFWKSFKSIFTKK